MISTIKGIITYKDIKYVIVEAGGIGYKVSVSADTLTSCHEGNEVFLWTHLAVRDDAFELYGFNTREGLSFFGLLISVSGIGPKSAIGILSASSIDMLKDAIATGDTSLLTKVSGVGKKSAEKIILELRDKVGARGEGSSVAGDIDAIEALEALGYNSKDARDAMKNIPKHLSAGEKVKHALKSLGSPTK
ncbi:MAG: Holliday junction branch migration protein RuvA [Candidatus Paceibacterota bacterium]|jgi:Holliday junction DNA helicase RuvA